MAREVAPGIVMLETPFDGVPLMLYVIDGGSELAIVDSGIASTPDTFIAPYFESIGRVPDLLINSHAHVDHYGGNGRMKVLYPNLRIAAHHIDARHIEDIERHIGEFYRQMPDDWSFGDTLPGFMSLFTGNTAVDHRLEDDQLFRVGSREFEVIRTSGHSPGHITLFERSTGVAITGDVALGWGPPTAPGTPSAPSVYTDADAYLTGMERVLGLGATTYCTGHFGTLDHPAMQKIAADSTEFVESFDRWTLAALEGGNKRTLHEIAVFISQQLPDYDFGFHIHASAQANLDRHLRAGRVRTVMVDGRRHYRIA